MKPAVYCVFSVLLLNGSLPAAPFKAGNIAVCRVGSGSGALQNSATAVFIDEYSPVGVLVQSIALPTAVNGSQRRLTASGTAVSEGSIQLSSDRKVLTLAGYDANPGTATIASTSSGIVNRTVAFVEADGTIDTSTAVTSFNGQNIRSAVSSDGTGAWLCGGNSGIIYVPRSNGLASTTVSFTSASNRSVDIFGGQLYLSSGSGTLRIGSVGSGLPRLTGASIQTVPGGPGTAADPYQFVMFDLDPAVAGLDTLYTADDTEITGGIQKYALVNGSWILRGNVGASGTLANIRGLTGQAAGTVVTLYAANAARLVTLTDSSGYNGNVSGSPILVATAPANTVFRGVDFAPVASMTVEPPPTLSVAANATTVTVAWPSPSAGWTLQQTASLATGTWVASTGILDDGSVKRLVLTALAGRLFFRLAKL